MTGRRSAPSLPEIESVFIHFHSRGNCREGRTAIEKLAGELLPKLVGVFPQGDINGCATRRSDGAAR